MITISRLSPTVSLPEPTLDGGCSIHTNHDLTIRKNSCRCVVTDLKLSIPNDSLLVVSSSLALITRGLTQTTRVIGYESDHLRNLTIYINNSTNGPVNLIVGEMIARMHLIPNYTYPIRVVELTIPAENRSFLISANEEERDESPASPDDDVDEPPTPPTPPTPSPTSTMVTKGTSV